MENKLIPKKQKTPKSIIKQQLEGKEITVANILSAIDIFKQSYNSQLSAIPLHPYDKYKALYLNPSEPPLHVSQLPIRSYSLLTLMEQISAASVYHNSKFYEQIPALTANNPEAGMTMFTVMSGDKFVTDKEKLKEHFRFLQMLENLDDKAINEEAIMTTFKIINEFVRIYSPPSDWTPPPPPTLANRGQ